ncbi:MAG: SUF system NifU family Fe-S cluster assembly protein [Dehalococcoidia bacterium]|nr:SUF system NifU family Fe-S cluster assembly protein [Dehalococcoidia bacterium]
MSQLQELYQEVVLEHTRRPRNFRKLEGATHSARGYNPFCGDNVTLLLKVEGGVVKDVGFQGSGCAISTSSASMMTEGIKGKTVEEAQKLFTAFHGMVTREQGADFDAELLGDLEILSGVSEFPTRVKCATLAWHALQAALTGRMDAVSTE